MHIVKKEKGKFFSLPSEELNGDKLKVMSSLLARDILRILAKSENYPLNIARTLKVHEQKVYYHIKNLEKAKIIKKSRQDVIKGVVLNYYKLVNSSFFIKFDEFKETQKIVDDYEYKDFFNPFIINGKLNTLIVVGSPSPHGKLKARSRDVNMALEFALFLGTFLNHIPTANVKLDIDIKSEDMFNNLILIGGPRVNRVTDQVNDKLPIYYDEKEDYSLKSNISGKTYCENECGMIVKIKNPFDKTKQILAIGGKSTPGTKASILAFIHNLDEIIKGNKFNNNKIARVVEGLDLNSDGIIDSIEFKE
jgi:DNA-binding transcriptional ArsR family regulator